MRGMWGEVAALRAELSMVEATDERVGRLVAAIDRLGIRDRTLILFTGDNGTAKRSIITAVDGKLVREPVVSKLGDVSVPGGKGELTDGGTNVPLIASWPRVIDGGEVVDDLVDFSDFLPTFANLAGFDVFAVGREGCRYRLV